MEPELIFRRPAHLRRRRHAVIFAGSMHGKTTAHRRGLGHDAEAPPPDDVHNYIEWSDAYVAYKKQEDLWKDTRIPENLEKRNAAFNEMCIEAYSSDLEVIFSHYSAQLENHARQAGREIRWVLIDYNEMVHRVAEQDEDPPIFRLVSSYGYASGLAARFMNTDDYEVFPTIEKAIASL